jgi:hypothetical protein
VSRLIVLVWFCFTLFLSGVLLLVLYILLVFVCYRLFAAGRHSNKGIELSFSHRVTGGLSMNQGKILPLWFITYYLSYYLVLGCIWPYLTAVEHVNKLIELNDYYYICLLLHSCQHINSKVTCVPEVYDSNLGRLSTLPTVSFCTVPQSFQSNSVFV